MRKVGDRAQHSKLHRYTGKKRNPIKTIAELYTYWRNTYINNATNRYFNLERTWNLLVEAAVGRVAVHELLWGGRKKVSENRWEVVISDGDGVAHNARGNLRWLGVGHSLFTCTFCASLHCWVQLGAVFFVHRWALLCYNCSIASQLSWNKFVFSKQVFKSNWLCMLPWVPSDLQSRLGKQWFRVKIQVSQTKSG